MLFQDFQGFPAPQYEVAKISVTEPLPVVFRNIYNVVLAYDVLFILLPQLAQHVTLNSFF